MAIASILLVANTNLAQADFHETSSCSENDEICKEVVIDDTNGGVIEIGDAVVYTFLITATNTSSETWVDVQVQDRFGGDLAVGDPTADLTMWNHAQEDILLDLDNLDCELSQFGKAKKEKLDCVIDLDGGDLVNGEIDVTGDDELSPDETAFVSLEAQTDYNHGQSKKYKKDGTGTREYTSCGIHSINSGATVLYYLESDDQELVEKRSASTDPLYVEVFTVDQAGDCDGDGTIDSEDTYPFDLDNDGTPDIFDEDIDGDGLNNDVDPCPEDNTNSCI
jgi:hypothetical protein